MSNTAPRVYNKRNPNTPKGAVYIGRPSPFGNPFTHLTSGSWAQKVVASREEAVRSYEEWLLGQPELVEKVKAELKGKDLVCWCAPRSCHGDVLLRIANED